MDNKSCYFNVIKVLYELCGAYIKPKVNNMKTTQATGVSILHASKKINLTLTTKMLIFCFGFLFFPHQKFFAQIAGNNQPAPVSLSTNSLAEVSIEPIQLLDFKVDRIEQCTQIDWLVNDVKSVYFFKLLRSYDGVLFDDLAYLKTFSITSATDFTWCDRTLSANKTAYYRLDVHTIDGEEQILGTLVLYPEVDKTVSLQPNPTKNKCIVQFEAGPEDVTAAIHLFDSQAKLINSEEMEVIRGINKAELDLEHFPTGVYLIRITLNSGSECARVVKY